MINLGQKGDEKKKGYRKATRWKLYITIGKKRLEFLDYNVKLVCRSHIST